LEYCACDEHEANVFKCIKLQPKSLPLGSQVAFEL